MPENQPPPTARTSSFNPISWIRDLALSVLIAVVLIVFIYQPVKVEGTSMMPALRDQERIFINKFTYRFGIGDIQRSDTVVFWYPGDISKSYIKRVIGLPGDVVGIDRGTVIVNGKRLPEDYVPEKYRDYQSHAGRAHRPWPVLRFRDHRSSSNDSRSWGTCRARISMGKRSLFTGR